MDYLKNEFNKVLEGTNNGLNYEDIEPLRVAAYKTLLINLKRQVGTFDGKKITELGSGTGYMLTLFEKEGAECLACDKSEIAKTYLTFLNQYYGTNVGFSRRNFMETSVPDEKFDLVYNFGVIEHFPPDEQLNVLNKMKELSKNWILLGIPNMDEESSAFNCVERNADEGEFCADEEHYEVNLHNLFHQADIEIVLYDGFDIFLTESELLSKKDEEAKAFLEGLSNDLPSPKYCGKDIDKLINIELNTCGEDRRKFGFQKYILGRIRNEN